MSTRCSITIMEGGRSYRIYRHFDGYPEGVLADLKVMLDNSFAPWCDPEYFLANFVFFAKLTEWVKGSESDSFRPWTSGYGVCSPACEHGDLEYRYTLQRPNIKIERVRYGSSVVVYEGLLEDAIKRYVNCGDVCHIDPVVIQWRRGAVLIENYCKNFCGKSERQEVTTDGR